MSKKINLKFFIVTLAVILIANTLITRPLLDYSFLNRSIFKFFLTFISIILIGKIGGNKLFKFSSKSIVYILISLAILFGAFYFIHLLVLSDNYTSIPLSEQLSFALYNFSVGLFEELFFRVFIFLCILNIFKKNLFISALIASGIFGLAHISNLFYPGVYPLSVINQIVFAFGIGMVFQTVLIKTKSILFVATLHAAVNQFGAYKRKLFHEVINSPQSEYTLPEFFTSLLIILFITLFICIPIAKILLRNTKNKSYWFF